MSLNKINPSYAALAFIASIAIRVPTAGADTLAVVQLGDIVSEAKHQVRALSAEKTSYAYPNYWVMNVRSSAFQPGCEPYRVFDADPNTHWQVSGKPPAPMARGQWIEFDLNRAIKTDTISIRWIGNQPYKFKIYDKPFEDYRGLKLEATSKGQAGEFETYKLPTKLHTRAVRIEFASEENGALQGIQEIRLGGLKWPDSYPQAAHPAAPVELYERVYYVEFERMMAKWPTFTLKRPLADGGTARRILPRADAFEGGSIDFTLPVDGKQTNTITLKLWESNPTLMTVSGNGIILEAVEGSPAHANRWFLPAQITEEPNFDFEWYGTKPAPGRWVYVSYRLPLEITRSKRQARLRLQGVGNMRRDHPMRAPSPPIYIITSHTGAFWEISARMKGRTNDQLNTGQYQ